ncbi:MAG: hypothetical protein KatS3mg114_0402 [Planctomycetaceae bacterium]|nr:MAG: hypothetical protein KatS3mg114_0402 [Planctomycetaceae bacterium]
MTGTRAFTALRQIPELAHELMLVAQDFVEYEGQADDEWTTWWQSLKQVCLDWQRKRFTWLGAEGGVESGPRALPPLVAEILLTDMFLRIWGSMVWAQDRRHHPGRYTPVFENGFTQVQHEVAQILHYTSDGGNLLAVWDRFRRQCERWTDVLIGPILVRYGVAVWAHDPHRAWEYGEQQLGDEADSAVVLTQAGFRVAFRHAELEVAPSSACRALLKATLACCPREVYDRQLSHWNFEHDQTAEVIASHSHALTLPVPRSRSSRLATVWEKLFERLRERPQEDE